MAINIDTAELYKTGQFADLTLRSSDNINFAVHRLVVCKASPSLIHRASSPSSKLIRVDQEGWILDRLLQRVYNVIKTPLEHEKSVEVATSPEKPETPFQELLEFTAVALAAEDVRHIYFGSSDNLY
ncbi:hypothetical protein K431DRAFT_280905 [Polychaeton citri CBS 116435]|uniref:BTB domain-containing protein n=1 Tax=Polychaeton citri CBS 116435 TaxID=1314669 RepID=A0A9P4QIJ1_9PEZI|nr:hypothetical protein K431DRAFT_280905 [Polychaeton citri CBS 116435]